MITPPQVDKPVPTEWVLDSDADVHVANVELGVTFYLAEPLQWAQQGAAKALELFMQLAPRDHLLWYTTSRLDTWKRVTQSTLHELLDVFSVHWLGQLRHGFEFVLADDTGSECTGFRYVEVDPTRVARTSLLELTLPAHFDPAQLEKLADAVFELGPVRSGIGGYALRYNPLHKGTAFTCAHGFAKRYVGLDMQDRDVTPWLVLDKLPGVSWLNYLGTGFLEASGLDAAALCAHAFEQPIAVTRSARGLRIQAGKQPTLVDLNRFEDARVYEELARQLQAFFVPEPSPLYGKFVQEEDATAWFRRFIEPTGWV